ncbi:unnamed protein product [Sphagnum balticum]
MSSNSRKYLTSLTTTAAATSQLKSLLTPSELSVLKTKQDRSLALSKTQATLERLTSEPSSRSLVSTRPVHPKPPSKVSSKLSTPRDKVILELPSLRHLQPVLEITSQALRSTRSSITQTRTEMELSAIRNSWMSQLKFIRKYDHSFYPISNFSTHSLLLYSATF